MAGPLKLPPGAVLVDDGTQGGGMKLPPGATLVNGTQPPPETPGFLSRGVTAIGDAIKGAGISASNFITNLGTATGGQTNPGDYIEPFRHPSELKYLPDVLKGGLEAQGDLLTRSTREYGEGKPIQGFTHGLEYMLPFVGPSLAKAGDQLAAHDFSGGAGTTAGVASMLFGPKAVEAAPKIPVAIGDTLKNSSYGLYNNVLGTKGAQMAFDGNPGRGVAREGMVAGSRGKLLDQINAALKTRGSQVDQVLQLPQNANKNLDISGPVNDPFKTAINEGVTGSAPTGTLSRMRQTQRELTETRDPSTFEFTGEPKNLTSVSPFDANQVKRGIYDRTNYRNPDFDEAVNNTLKQSGFGVKTAVNDAVPEVVPFNQRVSDLSVARGALSARINRTRTNPGASGFKDVAPAVLGEMAAGPVGGAALIAGRELFGTTPIKTAVAQGLYKTGNLFSPDAALTMPEARYPSPPALAGLLTSGATRLPSSMEPISPASGPPSFNPFDWNRTTADRRGYLLPEGPKQIPAYGYTAQNDLFGDINPPDPMAQPAASVTQRGPRGMFQRMYTTSTKRR